MGSLCIDAKKQNKVIANHDKNKLCTHVHCVRTLLSRLIRHFDDNIEWNEKKKDNRPVIDNGQTTIPI